MRDLEVRESDEFKQGEVRGVFYSREIIEVISSLWNIVTGFLERIRNGILTVLISHRNFTSLYLDCNQCFTVDINMEKSNLNLHTASDCLKTPTSGNCSTESTRKRPQSRKCPTAMHSDIYDELQNLNLLENCENEMDDCQKITTKDGLGVKCKRNEQHSKPSNYFEECILRISQIPLSDFTTLFNKFVRQNGRDFAKSDLLWWCEKFTQFIYLKEEFYGEPSNLREKLLFRSIQSKRDSIMQRLYSLRDNYELQVSAEDFYTKLRAKCLHPVQTIVKNRQNSGDAKRATEKGDLDGDKTPNDYLRQERKPVRKEIENKSDMSENAALYNTSGEVRAETIDLEQEGMYTQEKADDHKQQTISNSVTRKKKKTARKTRHIARECGHDDETDRQAAKFYTQPETVTLCPVEQSQCREHYTLVKPTIYITRNGFVQVSQCVEKQARLKKVDGKVFARERTINYYIDYLDEKQPLPANVEVKPLPPGGLDAVFRGTTSSISEADMAECQRMLSEAEKELSHQQERYEKAENSDATKSTPKNLHKQKTRTLKPPSTNVQDNQMSYRNTSMKLEPPVIDGESPKTNQTETSGNVIERDDQRSEMRGHVPLTSEPNNQMDVPGPSGQKETHATGEQEVNGFEDKTDGSIEQRLFEKLPPLNFIDTDTDYEACGTAQKPVYTAQEPVYLETNATVDYSRHVVEPSHGDRPNRKKLQAEIKEKVKTKGKANKHIKSKRERTKYFFDEVIEDTSIDNDTVEIEDGSDLDKSTTEQIEEIPAAADVVNAADQPQVQDDREFMMVPEEIRRIDDPRLKDIEDKYSIAANSTKRDKKKRKDKKNKQNKMNVSLEFVSDVHV